MTRPLLVVEDEQVMRAFLERALRRLGYQAQLVKDVDEALAAFAPRRFGLVLSDLRLPGRSGLDLLDQVSAIDPGTPVVIMTAYGSIETAVDAVRRGAADFLTKPLEMGQLELVLQRTLERREESEELDQLRAHADEREGLGGLVGRSLGMKRAYTLIDKVAPRSLTVLVLGETGTGKEVCARTIHQQSRRAKERFQVVNCAGLQETLLESELFGHEKGAFTGADKQRKGHFEVANKGTLFLDEVGEAPASVQVKLLRAIQEKEIVRVGGTEPVKVDVRIIAATHRDLEAEATAGRFRQDLFYRLSPFPIRLPPLRERPDDIPLLVEHFLAQDPTLGGELSVPASLALASYAWPGNVRQLQNVIARAAVLAEDGLIELEHLPADLTQGASGDDGSGEPGAGGPFAASLLELPLREARARFERVYVEHLLRQCSGNVSQAARKAGLGRPSLHEKINKLGLSPDDYRP